MRMSVPQKSSTTSVSIVLLNSELLHFLLLNRDNKLLDVVARHDLWSNELLHLVRDNELLHLLDVRYCELLHDDALPLNAGSKHSLPNHLTLDDLALYDSLAAGSTCFRSERSSDGGCNKDPVSHSSSSFRACRSISSLNS